GVEDEGEGTGSHDEAAHVSPCAEDAVAGVEPVLFDVRAYEERTMILPNFVLSRLSSRSGIALAAALVVGCGSTVAVGGGSEQNAIEAGSGGAAGSGAGGGAVLYGTDPLTLHIASFPLTCAAPDAPPPASCDWYDIEMSFAKALLAPGSLDMS